MSNSDIKSDNVNSVGDDESKKLIETIKNNLTQKTKGRPANSQRNKTILEKKNNTKVSGKRKHSELNYIGFGLDSIGIGKKLKK